MKVPVIALFLLFFSSPAFSQVTEIIRLYSKEVRDSFTITVRKPPVFMSSKKYHYVYMTDGGIGMGDYVLGKDKSWAATIPSGCILIAISHPGNWHQKRNRDFIPTDLSKNPDTNFGRADRFYLFLKNELLPLVEGKMPYKKDRVFIGHSLGGLFCLYTIFKEDRLFDRHYAISPSCWANHHEIDKIEAQFAQTHTVLPASLTIYVGGLEFLNKVLPCTRNFYHTVTKRNYRGLTLVKHELGNANHFSIRKPAVDRIFESLKD